MADEKGKVKTAKRNPVAKKGSGKATRKQEKKMASPAANIESHRSSVPFDKIGKLYAEGKSMEQIAKAVGRFNPTYPDPTKSLRAIVSRMITKGYRNSAGKIVKLEKRPRSKAEEKKAPPKKKVKKLKAEPKQKASPKPKIELPVQKKQQLEGETPKADE